MALALPHNITNGTVPDADEVMANLNALLNQANRTFTAGATGAAVNAGQTTNGTSTGTSGSTSLVVAVAVPSLLVISYYSTALHSWSQTKTTSTIGKIEPTLDGSTTGAGIMNEHYVVSAGDSGSARIPMSGTEIIGLTIGSHTVALKYTQTVTTGGGFCAIQMRDSGWTGLVIPQ